MKKEQLAQYEDDIRNAEGHIKNAKDWIRKTRAGKEPAKYHIDEALAEAGAILMAAVSEKY